MYRILLLVIIMLEFLTTLLLSRRCWSQYLCFKHSLNAPELIEGFLPKFFQNQEASLLCLCNKKRLLERNLCYHLGADLTMAQRNCMKNIHTELAEHNIGEENIYIKYTQGVQHIVKSKLSKNTN